MSEVESGRVLNFKIVKLYEHSLGLVPGQLGAPISILCRTFPTAPADGSHRSLAATPEAVSARTRVVADGTCRGGDWLAWASLLTDAKSTGLPMWLLDGWLDRLISEMGRSCGVAYAPRYEALCLLRSGPYAGAVFRAAVRAISEPGVQVLFGLMSAVSEYPDTDCLEWSCDLLFDPRPHVVRGACLALENAMVGGTVPEERWVALEPRFVEAFNSSKPHDESHGAISALLVSLPTPSRRRVRPHLTGKLSRPKRYASFGPREANPRWRLCEGIAERLVQDHGMGDPLVLTRVIFEFLFDYRETRMATSMFLLNGLPAARTLFETLFSFALHHDTAPSDRDAALERLVVAQSGAGFHRHPGFSLASDHPDHLTFVTMQAQAGEPVPTKTLARLLDRGGFASRRALYAAGLTGDDWLVDVAQDRSRPRALRQAADWWLRHGGRITDSSDNRQGAQ